MINYYRPLLFKIFLFTGMVYSALPVKAQLINKPYPSNFIAANNSFKSVFKPDTSTTSKDSTTSSNLSSPSITNAVKLYDDESLINAEESLSKPKERKQLMGYLKQITGDEDVNYNQSHTKFLYKLATVFAKLRLYPLAMKCYLKTITPKAKYLTDTLQQANNSGYLAINTKDDSLLEKQALLFAGRNSNKNSKPTTYNQITNTLDDGKKAVAYAMLFHVKQPIPGKRTIFVLGNTGHTFITLIKYNVDSTYSSFSFGFYPKKRNPLSATPIEPTASSVFKDDTDHQWDEVLGKFISKRRFDKIMLLVKQYDHLEYHLSNNNCTDFGLKAVELAGINIDGTIGKWPLGHGNNPAITGQSILEGKFTDTDTGKAEGLFYNTTIDK
jgi:hypothetical protein